MAANRLVVAVTAAVALAACASHQSSGVVQSASGAARWTGNFKQTGVPSAQIGPATPNRGFGTVVITPLGTTPPSAKVELSISTPLNGGVQVAWAVLDGACGSAAPLVTGENQFQPIEITTGGNGSLRTSMTLALEPRQSYHVNVYWTNRAGDVSNVMMCAPLAIDRR